MPENEDYLSSQLITYLGNKRNLLSFMEKDILKIQKRLNNKKLKSLDLFSGSGVVSRFLKQFSSSIISNDLENYSEIINNCYLTNKSDLPKDFITKYTNIYSILSNTNNFSPGIISELYAPKDGNNILQGERCFYTPYNANYLDTARKLIATELDKKEQKFLLAPLLSEASIHTNTSGVFKGFYKNKKGIGQFGGEGKNALTRICGKIEVKLPLFSNFECDFKVYREDANALIKKIDEVDIAYLDPPYNQHPYGSNYFMLNVLTSYIKPEKISDVSGIPENWNRSEYNKKEESVKKLIDVVEKINAKFVLISFSDDGFISKEEMVKSLKVIGKVSVSEQEYNTFRGSKNLTNREIHIKEYLYLVEK